jgi:hypothetical protein
MLVFFYERRVAVSEETVEIEGETARLIPCFPGYCVTASGKVFTQHTPRGCKPLLRSNKWRRLHGRDPSKGKDWRISFRLKHEDGKKRGMQCGFVVLLAWNRPRPEGKECCHNDGDHLNNNLGNLRWDTISGNQADRVKHGTDQLGEKNYSAKLTEGDVKNIRRSDEPQKALAEFYGVSRGTIYSIKRRMSWSHIND